MQFHKEILRGVRLAAILFALVLGTLTSYRIMHSTPAQGKQEVKQEVKREVTPTPVAATPPASHASTDPEVPPPPPAPGRTPVRRTPRQSAPAGSPVLVLNNVESVITAAPETPLRPEPVPTSAPIAEEKPAPADPAPVVTAQKTEAPAPSSNAADESARKSGKHGNRLFRSVGRLLHVGGKKDAPEEAARP